VSQFARVIFKNHSIVYRYHIGFAKTRAIKIWQLLLIFI